jgi:hypothetical protein
MIGTRISLCFAMAIVASPCAFADHLEPYDAPAIGWSGDTLATPPTAILGGYDNVMSPRFYEDADTATGMYSIVIGKGQNVTEDYHLRIGTDPTHWVDVDMRSGKATMAPGLKLSGVGDVCFGALNAANVFQNLK